jgi:hypothetical protein
MATVKALTCDVCKDNHPSLEVESYRIRYPGGGDYPADLCPVHAAPLVKLRESLPEPKARAKRRSTRKTALPLD